MGLHYGCKFVARCFFVFSTLGFFHSLFYLKRIRAVMSAFENFSYAEDNILINALYYESETDARDDNNLGCVMTFKAVVQFL